jgi:hypothetical protein
MKYFFCVACLPACLKPLFAFSLKMENRFIGERQSAHRQRVCHSDSSTDYDYVTLRRKKLQQILSY